MARVLEKNYPATTSHELSLQQMENLESELDDWYDNMPSHLRLNFVQDKPSTDVTGSRSPLLVRCTFTHASEKLELTEPGAGILLHSDFNLPPCSRFESWPQGCARSALHQRVEQAHHSDHPAS